jgi:hypothetical protein
LNPGDHFIANRDREFAHLRGICLRHGADTFVAGDIALLSESVECRYDLDFRTYGFTQGLDDPVVVLVTGRSSRPPRVQLSTPEAQRYRRYSVPIRAYLWTRAIG